MSESGPLAGTKRLIQTSVSGQLSKGHVQRKINKIYRLVVMAASIRSLSHTGIRTKLLSAWYAYRTGLLMKN